MDGWFRKLRRHSDVHHRCASNITNSTNSATNAMCETHKRKQPSFIKALFQPHELKAVGHVRADASSKDTQRQCRRQSPLERSNQVPDQQQQQAQEQSRVTPPVEIPSTYMGREFHGAMTVGGRRVPFTHDAHRRSQKKRVKVLASISELHAVRTLGSASMQAYRSRAYYQPPASKTSSSSSRKDKR